MHGMKYLAAQFPKGMVALAGAYLGRCHDARMLYLSGWDEILCEVERQTHSNYVMFGDAGFACSSHVQAMVRGYSGFIGSEARRFNALMSRIRIYIENHFGECAKSFPSLSFKIGLRLGGRGIDRIYEVMTFLMNVRTTFYGNQFTVACSSKLCGYLTGRVSSYG
jgi:nuclease HARBI1